MKTRNQELYCLQMNKTAQLIAFGADSAFTLKIYNFKRQREEEISVAFTKDS